MKQSKIVIILILIVLILVAFIGGYFYNNNQFLPIKEDNKLWNIYDFNISKIENYLNPISNPNEAFEWWELKDFDIEDEEYKNTLNKLLSDIRMKYIELTDENVMYTDSNPIRKYKNKENITKKDLELAIWRINNANNFKFKFENYKSIVLSNNEENTEIFLNKMDEIEELQKQYFIEEPKTYSDVLYNEIIETQVLIDLSEFLNTEYVRLKNN